MAKPRKKVSAAELARRKAVSQAATTKAFERRNPVEHYKNLEREHYTRQFAELNTPMTDKRIAQGFGPLEEAVFDIERTGEGTVDRQGNYLFMPYPEERTWYNLPRAIIKACEVYELMDPGMGEKVAGLRLLARRLEVHMPLSKQDMDAAAEGFLAMRKAARGLTPNQLIELVQRVDPDDDEEPSIPA